LLDAAGAERDSESMEIWTIEVLDGQFSADVWSQSHREHLVEAAVTHGARDWRWVTRDWGLILELGFADVDDWLRFRATPAVQAALDAVPDPVNGLYIYSGPGGSSGVRHRRRPRPKPAAGAAERPLPVEPLLAAPEPFLRPPANEVAAAPPQPVAFRLALAGLSQPLGAEWPKRNRLPAGPITHRAQHGA
jgi:hypothetical protein